MSEPKPQNNPPSNQVPAKAGEVASESPDDVPTPGQLTKEEQWALFEKELKESDWGHQPC
jgi:hypothetical protein